MRGWQATPWKDEDAAVGCAAGAASDYSWAGHPRRALSLLLPPLLGSAALVASWKMKGWGRWRRAQKNPSLL